MSEASGLKTTLQRDLQEAIRGRDKVRASTLRMALTSVRTQEVSGTQERELGDDEVLAVLSKEAKKRREAAGAFAGAGRTELAEVEEAELAVLEAYLPTQLDDAALADIAGRAVAEVGATGLPQMGQVMKVAQAQVAGRAEGGRVAAAVRAALTR